MLNHNYPSDIFVIVYPEEDIELLEYPPTFPDTSWEKIRFYPCGFACVFYKGIAPKQFEAETYGQVVSIQESDVEFWVPDLSFANKKVSLRET